MKIKLSSVFVDDQDKALKFYTEVLRFVKKTDIPVGEYKWLTVVSPVEPEGVELLLEPSDNPATKTFKKAIFEQGRQPSPFSMIPAVITYRSTRYDRCPSQATSKHGINGYSLLIMYRRPAF